MLLNYVRVSYRTIHRNKGYTILTILGLATGLTASILLLVWAQDELSYDRFHQDADRIYRVNAHFNFAESDNTWGTVPAPVAVFAKDEIPSVEEAVRLSFGGQRHVLAYNDIVHLEENNLVYADASFFSVFNFEFVKGNPSSPFENSHSMVITESIAKKYFGTDDPLGKIIRIDNTDDFIVTGILKDIPQNSTLQNEILLNFQLLKERFRPNEYAQDLESDWTAFSYTTFLMLAPGASAEQVGSTLTEIHDRNSEFHIPEYQLQPLSRIHLYQPDMQDAGMQTVRIFIIAAICILLIACINYINLTTARATQRAKEVGVRKTIGADRIKLVAQFMVESTLTILAAALCTSALLILCLPFFNEFTGKLISPESLFSRNAFLLAIVLIGTWVASAIYPALVLSSFQPIQVIRGKEKVNGSKALLRQVLVITQFTLSVAIIVGALVMQDQLQFISTKKLGMEKGNIMTFRLNAQMSGKTEIIKDELLRQPGIHRVGFASENIISTRGATYGNNWEGKDPDFSLMMIPLSVDQDFIATLQMQLSEGENFDGTMADSLKMILNETAVREAGLSDPIGKWFEIAGVKGTIVGVVKDFHHKSLKFGIDPIVFYRNPSRLRMAYVKVDGQDIAGAIRSAEMIWNRYNEVYPFSYDFLDSNYLRMYQSEQKTSQLFAVFTGVTLFIACMGLLGLASFATRQRVKEIGIRKVMGANLIQIIVLLGRDFIKLIVIAWLIAIPISFFGMNRWLQDFSYRTEVNWVVLLLLAGSLAVLMAIIATSFHTIRSALSRPVDALRAE